jgi:exopolyphosphatase
VARNQFFSTLHDAKFDVSGLTVAELLRRDYKEFVAGGRRLGMSAVLRDLRAMEAKELQASAEQWMATQRLDVLVVMTAFYEGPERIFSRQNWVLAREESVADAIGSHLASDVSLQLTPLPLGDGVRGRAYSQGDVRPSRKQLAPLVIDFIEKSKL